jgi:Protein of unknown function (DUF2752)
MQLIRERSPLPRLLVFPLLVLGVFAVFFLRYRPDFVLGLARCPLKDVTGIPCPTCGSTSAAAALAVGDLASAWSANPLLVFVVIAFLVWATASLLATAIPRLRYSVDLGSREERAASILAALVLLLAWIRQLLNQP